MEKYKSLLFREWKVTKKFYISKIFLFLVFVALFAVAAYVATPKNDGAATDVTILALGLSLFLGCLPAVLVAEDNGLYKSDVNFGWLNFSQALPVTSFDKALAKYLFKTIVILAGLALTLLAVAGICFQVGAPIQMSGVYAFIWVVDVVLVCDLVKQYIIMHTIDTKYIKRIWYIGNIILIVWLMLPIDVFSNSKIRNFFEISMRGPSGNISEAEKELLNRAYTALFDFLTISHLSGCIGFLLMIVILIVSFVVTRRCYERRKA